MFRGTKPMNSHDELQSGLLCVDANENFTQAVMQFRDRSRLCFCHTVHERWARAFGSTDDEEDAGLAGRLLAEIVRFRLNAKHLDIWFNDGSRWDQPVGTRS
jgi:hypothetical protein